MKKSLTVLILMLLALTGVAEAAKPAYSCDFSQDDELEQRWRFHAGIIGVNRTQFSIDQESTARNGRVLAVEADRATGAMVSMPREVKLKKTPYLHWRWRIIQPIQVRKAGVEPDDQAVVFYVGDGSSIGKRAIAYRWESLTPVGKGGSLRYGMGILRVRYVCLRNRETPCGEWVEEERNVYQDFLDAFHEPPNDIFVISIGANSQHTKCSTRVEIDFIEFNEKPVLASTAKAEPLFR